jgi:hypothetical protein
LISNIGFANQASHTHLATDRQAALPTEPMPFPLHHPPFVARDAIADREYFASYYSRYHFPLPVRVYRKIASLLKRLPPGGR